MTPDDILPTYQAVARTWAKSRDRSLFEQAWLDRFLLAAPGPRVLDLGCGSGVPIASYLISEGATVTGIDGAPAMIAEFHRNLPGVQSFVADMRGLDLGAVFDGLIAWNSFFHLSPADQRSMFPVFAAHLEPGGALLFTAGPRAGAPIGSVEGRPVYHASLDPEEYREVFTALGFEELAFKPEDPECRGHTVWLVRLTV